MRYKQEYLLLVRNLDTNEVSEYRAFNLRELQVTSGHKISSADVGTTRTIRGRYEITLYKSSEKVLDNRPKGVSYLHGVSKERTRENYKRYKEKLKKDRDIPKVPDMPNEEYDILLRDYYLYLTGVPLELQRTLIETGRQPFESLNINEFGYGNKA